MKLDSILEIAPHLHLWYDQDITVFVVDPEKVLLVSIGNSLDLGVREGQPMEMYHNSGAYKALISGKRVITRVNDPAVFKIPYVAIAAPIIDNGEIVAALSITISIEKYDRLLRLGEDLMAAIQQVYASGENLSAQSEELAATAHNMDSETANVRQDINHINSIASEIKSISDQSNILGINASIEAARAGVKGAGFKVVADEVRKLAEHSKASAVNIESDLQKVQDSVGILIESVGQLAMVSEVQAIGVTELTQALAHISQLAEQLVGMGSQDMEQT